MPGELRVVTLYVPASNLDETDFEPFVDELAERIKRVIGEVATFDNILRRTHTDVYQ